MKRKRSRRNRRSRSRTLTTAMKMDLDESVGFTGGTHRFFAAVRVYMYDIDAHGKSAFLFSSLLFQLPVPFQDRAAQIGRLRDPGKGYSMHRG